MNLYSFFIFNHFAKNNFWCVLGYEGNGEEFKKGRKAEGLPTRQLDPPSNVSQKLLSAILTNIDLVLRKFVSDRELCLSELYVFFHAHNLWFLYQRLICIIFIINLLLIWKNRHQSIIFSVNYFIINHFIIVINVLKKSKLI